MVNNPAAMEMGSDRPGPVSIFNYTIELVREQTSLVTYCFIGSSVEIRDTDFNALRVIIARAFRCGDVVHCTLTAIYA